MKTLTSFLKGNRAICLLVVISMVLDMNGVSASLCLEGEFDDQVKQLLDSQMLTKDEIANVSSVLTVLEKTFQKLWPGSKMYPQGSLITGLAMKFSDVDCLLWVPNFDIYNKTASSKLVLQAEKFLKRQGNLYTNIEAKLGTKHVPLLSFIYVPLQILCDVAFSSPLGFQITKFIPFYYSLDERARTLGAILKIWSVTHRTKLARKLNNYDMNLVVIFYLQQENILPPYHALKQEEDGHILIGDWKPRFNNSKSVYQLLGGFFKYYSNFNFDKYVVSPALGRPILKTDFLDIDSLPDELSLYKKNMKKQHREKVTSLPKMVIQDMFLEKSIEDSNISEELAIKFKSDVDYAAAMFDQSKDRFLRSILIKDEHNKVTDALDDVEECRPRRHGSAH